MDLKKPVCGVAPLAIAVVVLAITAAAAVQLQDPETAARLGGEDGPFELASVGFYGIGFALTFYGFLRQRSALRLAGSLVLLWAMLRELDFQKRFTYRSIESLGYYTRSIAPWSEKLLVLLGLLPFVWAIGCVLLALVRHIRPAWLRREAWPGHVAAILFLLLLGGFLEKILHFGPAEEVCESGASFLALLLAWSLRAAGARPKAAPGGAL
jgi:uncharacterized membrane protein